MYIWKIEPVDIQYRREVIWIPKVEDVNNWLKQEKNRLSRDDAVFL